MKNLHGSVVKTIKLYDSMVKEELYKEFEQGVEEVKDVIMITYDTELVVRNRKSKTNPLLPKYRDEFIQRLNSFEYIEEVKGGYRFVVPDMDTFDFSGSKMRVIEQILEGTAGVYVEVSLDDYEKMFGKKIISREPLDTSVPKKEIIYLMRYDANVRSAELRVFGRRNYLTRYPFSNTPPIRILDEGIGWVKDNFDRWVKTATKTAIKRYKRSV